jgi:hypothetical protein
VPLVFEGCTAVGAGPGGEGPVSDMRAETWLPDGSPSVAGAGGGREVSVAALKVVSLGGPAGSLARVVGGTFIGDMPRIVFSLIYNVP